MNFIELSQATLLDAIASRNPDVAPKLVGATLSNPEVNSEQIIQGNSQVTLTPAAGVGLTGSVKVGYNRQPLSWLHQLLAGKIRLTASIADKAGVLGILATDYKIVVDANDLEVNLTADGETRTLSLTATASAMHWTGSTELVVLAPPV